MADQGIGDPSDSRASDVAGNWTVISLLKGILHSGGGGGGGGAVTIANGDDATEGAIADAAVTAGATGTVSAKLRSISRDVGTVAAASATQATATKQDTGNTSLSTIATNTTGASTAANQSTANTSLSNIDTNAGATSDAAVTAGATGSISAKLRAISRDIVANIVLKAGSAIIGQVGVDQTTPGTTDSVTVKASVGIGSLTETAPATDTASSGLNGRLQRIAQRLTTIIAGLITQPLNTTLTVTTVTANNSDMVAATDVSNYRSLTFQLTSVGGGATVQVQISLDGTTYTALVPTNGTSSSLTAVGLFYFTLPPGVLLRIRTTAYTSGNITGNAAISSYAITPYSFIESATTPNLRVSLYNSTNEAVIASGIDGQTAVQQALLTNSRPSLYNGTTMDTARANNAVTALASAARTATANADVVTYNAKTFRVILNITVAPNTASTLTLSIRAKDSISSNFVTLLTGGAETGSVDTGAVPVTKTYSVGAGLVATANVSSAEALARTMNVLVTHSNADSWTYSVSVELGV